MDISIIYAFFILLKQLKKRSRINVFIRYNGSITTQKSLSHSFFLWGTPKRFIVKSSSDFIMHLWEIYGENMGN